MIEFASQHAAWIVALLGLVALLAVNFSSLSFFRRNTKTPSGPAKRIIESANEILDQAWRLNTSEERNATQELADKIKHISTTSMIETSPEQ